MPRERGETDPAESPPAQETHAAGAESQSVTAESLPAQGVNDTSAPPADTSDSQESAPDSGAPGSEASLLAAMTAAAEATAADGPDDPARQPAGTADGEAAPERREAPDQADETDTPADAGTEPGTEPADGAGETDEDGKKLPPFHQHPRWQEMVRERNTYREQTQSLRPKAEEYDKIQQFMADNDLAVEDVAQNLKLAALMKHDPLKAREQLATHMERLDTFAGYRLPEDLQREVEDGAISEPRAQELARLRNQTRFQQERSEHTEQQLRTRHARSEAEALLREQVSAINAWEERTKAQDPDYALLQPTVHREMRLLVRDAPPRNKDEATALVDKAYHNAKAEARRLRPRKPEVHPGASSAQSGANAAAGSEPKSFLEAIERAANSQ